MADDALTHDFTTEDDEAFLMTNLYPRRTGLTMTIWVGPQAGARHDVRIKVNTRPGDRMELTTAAVVGVRPSPHLVHGDLSRRDLDQVSAWIRLNEDAILRMWSGEYDGGDLVEHIRPLPG